MIVENNSEIGIKATDMRKLLGYEEFPSTQFSLTKTGGDVIFIGKGYGHGVGLSQWGALEMARQGRNYREILAHYYPGTTLKNSEDLTYQDLASKITP
jgi:stage II sporulation protein D